MTDELDAPLGRKRKILVGRDSARNLRRLPVARIAFGAVFAILAFAVLRVVLVDDPLGGRPSTTVDVSSTRNTNQIASEVASDPIILQSPSAVEEETGPQVTNVEEALSGVVGEDAASPVALRALNEFGVDPDLVEETQNGPIPHVGRNGNTPFAAYARASVSPGAVGGQPLIAIVVTGLGLSESGTLDAITKLPDNVTLAFAPYGRSLQRTTSAARAEGHETLLQVPLEPFDYPDNDPGPQTLLTGQPPRANLDKLFWLMARFGGYIGFMNHMGARFTASAADFEPVMEELGIRGLGYFDDGSSNRSLAPQLAGKNRVPFARAELSLDDNPSRSAIFQGLDILEENARRNGSAIGVISALPVSIQAIAEWSEGLADKGILLVPVSTLMK